MWDIRLSSKFKKDLKRYQNQPKKIEELGVVLKALRDTGTVPASYKPAIIWYILWRSISVRLCTTIGFPDADL